MDVKFIEAVANLVNSKVGVAVRGSSNPFEARRGLSFWFENYNRGNGPVFSIRPSGLKRHIVSLKFGAYAGPCIDHIVSRATQDDYSLAYAFVNNLVKEYEVKINGEKPSLDWRVSSGFSIDVVRKVESQNDLDGFIRTVEIIMIPLIASIAELIGYEDKEVIGNPISEDAGEYVVEGVLSEHLIKKRERNPRNRLLCLSVHGEKCGVCGFVPRDFYGNDVGGILEVHHIEPLGELIEPKAYNPVSDLIPLCPNCHRAIHKRKPALLPEELRKLISL